MKNIFLLLQALFVFALFSVSCVNEKTAQSVCHVQVKNDYVGYTGFLKLPGGEALDTLSFIDGITSVERVDSAFMPYVAVVRLVNSSDSTDVLDMPLVIEGGNVRVEIGEYIVTTGTPLNDVLQRFLNELQTVSDSMKSKEGLTLEDVRKAYSSFYRAQILSNKSNVVGKYIYQFYGMNMLDEDKKAVDAVMNN